MSTRRPIVEGRDRPEMFVDVESLAPGPQGPLEDPAFERVHRRCRDAVRHGLQLSGAIDPCYGIDELEVQRCVHDAAMTVEGTGAACAVPLAIRAPEP